MKKFYLILIVLLQGSVTLVAQQQDVLLVNIKVDSLKTVVKNITGYDCFYKMDKGDENLLFSIQSTRIDFMKTLTQCLKHYQYTLTQIDNKVFIIKQAVLHTTLPDNYFTDNKQSETTSDILKVGSLNNTEAKSENKIYNIGDQNFPKKDGKALIRGYIRNLNSGEPIAGVSLIAEKTQTGATTDAFGFYRLMIPVGSGVINLKGYGLEDKKLMLQVFGDGEMDILMKDKIYALKGIVLTAESAQKMRSTNMGLEKIRIDRIKHIPAAFGEADVMKIVLTLPGVKSVGEASSGFNVRGGASDQNLILFNDGTIYNPTHLFGLFSAFNPDIVNDIELYKSTIPAKYGGRISSVLEINSRNGNSNKITGSAGLGLLTSKFHIEGPLKKDKTNFIAGIRTTYSNWIMNLLPKDSGYKEGKASFNDITLGVTHKLNNSNTLYAYGYYSGDGFRFSKDTSYQYRNINASIKWRSIINDKQSLLVSAGFDQYSYNTEEKGNPVNAYSLKFGIKQYFFKMNFNTLLTERHSLNYGLNVIHYNLNPGQLSPSGESSLVKPKQLIQEKAVELAFFLSDNWNLTDKLSLDLGLRYSLYSALGPLTYNKYDSDNKTEGNITETIKVASGKLVKPYHGPEIRASARYSINDDLSLKLGFNRMRQYIHMLSNTTSVSPTDIWKLSDANIVPQEGWQAAFGLYRNVMGKRVELSLEGYYKEMNNYLDYKGGAILNMNENIERDVIETQGRAYGIELLAKKPLGKLNGWFSYTYSRTMLKESGEKEIYNVNGGKWYPASYDKPHDIKLIANYKFTQRFSVSLNIDYSTGRPVTVPISKYYYGNGYRLFYSERNAYKIPDYFRMDFSVNIEPSHNLKLWTHSTITFGIYNLTGRKNAFSVYYDTNNGTKIRGYKLSIFGAPIPYVNYNIKF